jgi:HAMP domain-containing protein
MKNRIREIEEQITELKSRMPAHSIQPRMLQELEDLETELDDLKTKVNTKLEKMEEYNEPR